jgi:hypothetical protein
MDSHMKTTIELPEDLFVAAKKEAAERRVTLKVLVESGLRRELAAGRPGSPTAGKRPRIRWVTVPGGVPPGIDLADRGSIYDLSSMERRAK